MEKPTICKIKKIVEESPTVKTFILNKEFDFKPGQFAMIWIPEIDEKPFGFVSKNSFSVAKVGRFTEALHNLKEGDLIGVRGPYGTSFKPMGYKILAVAGGIGSAPIISAVENFSENIEITTILGGRTKEELLFKDRFEKCGKLYSCTDDGSYGYNGFTTTKMEEILKTENKKFDLIITCGPEIMMKKVVEIANKYNIPVQVSLERFMKCGIGICGQCAVDGEGLCVCKDGPVFFGDELKYIKEEFGNYRRDGSGAIVK
ncbi:oxidoreductase FAD/NAD(P)-binding domain protein [Methanococcus aeolicus Nankai-3]|uniref:Probable dihydroorotate dehydrogenase B (NAD(+)), electron transfer subunit n=1 Tax=Methanococcus aeolicus (strain ATCC BAA-1280 / DSM 17508 / OCM 812 / Nankai-3) TaxID=419665 RepID=A6UWS7_META3|nr:dihydroorotate dehydrogenase electron transfer subunit [Methanococcus aeolicus]ABR56949.1 oxidoreductase FAD/NAD(P)-binding domain protein [Methanococcus aeolicus Nankai-3]